MSINKTQIKETARVQLQRILTIGFVIELCFIFSDVLCRRICPTGCRDIKVQDNLQYRTLPAADTFQSTSNKNSPYVETLI